MNTTRKHPRTMQEAFGPYTSSQIHEPQEPMATGDKWIVGLGMAVMLVLLAAIFSGVI
jgi:hypothetical protein